MIIYISWARGKSLVDLIYFPFPKHTSHTQPMDLSVIRTLKAKYRSLAICKLILALERTSTNHINSVCYDHVRKSVECCLKQDLYQLPK